MEFVLIIKVIPNRLKNDVIIGDIFGTLFKVQMMTQIVLKSQREAKDAHEKSKDFICVKMLEEN